MNMTQYPEITLRRLLKYSHEKPELREKIYNEVHLVFLAQKHSLVPLVYHNIAQSSISKYLLEQSNKHSLKTCYLYTLKRNMLLSSELITLTKFFDTYVIPTLSFKGATLSQLLYNDIAMRQYGDLDILIKLENKEEVRYILKYLGYQEVLKLTPSQEKKWAKHNKDMGFWHSKKMIYIQIHWLLLDNDCPLQIDLTPIWDSPQTLLIEGYPIHTFPNEPLLVYLCIHGSQHLWSRIGWIKDIDKLIRTHTINWESISEKSTKNPFNRMFLLGLYLSYGLFNTPLPSSILLQFQHQNWLNPLSISIINNWTNPQSMFHNTLTMLHLFPTLLLKFYYLKKMILNRLAHKEKPLSPFLLFKKYLWKLRLFK